MTENFEETSIGEINKVKITDFEEIVDLGIKCITDHEKSFVTKSEEIASKCSLELTLVKYIIKQIARVLSDGVERNSTTNEMRPVLEKLGLTEDKIAVVLRKWDDNRFEISKNLISHTIANNRLVDIEWKFGVTAASSECNKVGNTFLQLKLTISKDDRLDYVHMELTLPQFYTLMHEVERAKASLELFS